MPIVVEIPNRGSIEFADGASDADIDAIVSKEFPPTPEDSYNKVLQFQAAQTDYTPSKQEYIDYLKVSKTKPLLGETPLKTIGTAAVQTAKDIAMMPYKFGEAVGQIYQPPEGATEGDVAIGTAAEIAAQSKLKAQSMARGAYDVALSNLEKLTGKLQSDDDRYQAFLATSDIKRQLARANAPEEQRVPAAQEFLQAYNIPQEAISQPGLEVGGFLADPSSIAFAGGGKLASMALQRGAAQIPRISAALQRGGENISAAARVPEEMLGRATTAVTGSGRMGEAVQGAVSTGSTGIALGEAAGLPISGTLNVPGVGTASRIIGGTKALGATLETVGEAGTVSGGPALTATQRGLLGTGERIAAAEGASAGAKAFGNAIARSGLEAPIKGAGAVLVPMVGAGIGGAALAGLTGEEGDAIAAAFGSGAAFGAFDAGFHLAKAASADAFKGGRVRQTAVDDLNTRPTEVQFTYVDPVSGEQTSTIKDADARAKLYANLDNKQLTKALSEVAGAEGSGVDVIFHTDADTVPTALQTVNYAGVAIGPKNIKSGKPTILINVDRAKPEALPHEILHARITQEVVNQLGSQVINAAVETPQGPSEFKKQFVDFAEKYAKQIEKSGGKVLSDEILTELRDAFDPTLQRAQNIKAIGRITDEFSAYYTQEMLKGKDPKTMLPGRIPSFFEMALNNAKEAVSERFTRRALQAGFDPVARSFYDANGRRIKIDWMEDAIKNLVTPKEGYEPTEQKVDTSKMTKAQQNALIMARGYSDLFMTAPDGSIVRPLSKAELAAKTADVANRTMKVVESVPQADRTSVSGMDSKGNPVIEGRLSLAEADAVSKSGIFSPSTSRILIDIAMGIRDGTLMEGKYWKVYGPTGKSGVFGESEKLFLPYGISINSKGGVNVKVVDWGKVQARMYKALTKPAYKNLFRNYDQAMSTLRDVYLKNIAEQNAAPSAEALGGGLEGAKKRNFFNEVMGAVPKQGDVMSNLPTAGYVANRKGGSVYQDLRIERLQNTNPTGAKIPWSGDMGEQSSYRRTQLNFQPAETIDETTVSTDQNGGYRILSKNGKFRLYGPDGSTAGIFDTEGQAKLKAEKDYATQTRLQPEVRQQQRLPGNEVRQTAEAGRGDSALGRTQGREEGRQELGTVRQAGDVVIAPDSETFTIPKADIGRFMPASDKVKLEDYADRKIIALAADRMGIGEMAVGPTGAKRKLSVLGQGGRGFMNIFNGGGWAFSDQATADRFISRLNKDADPNGNVIVGITVQSPINHLKNQTGQLAYIEAMQAAIDSKTITKRAADSQIAAMSSAIVNSTAKSIKQSARDKFSKINSLADLKAAVNSKQLNFADMEPLLTQMQRKALPITAKELAAAGISPADIARDIADPELADVPFGSVVALLGVNVKQAPEKTGFHYSYPWTIHGETIGYLDKFYNISDLTTEQRIRNKAGTVTAQPLQTVMPVMDNIINTIKTKQGIPSVPSERFMPSDTDYLSAVKAGDTATAQRMVDEAAKAAGLGESRLNNAGNPEEMFHGSGWSAHNVFERGKSPSGQSKPYPGYGLDDIGFWFTSSKNQANEYGSVLQLEGGKRPPTRLYNVFLDIKNPLEFSDQQEFNDWIESYAKTYAVDETSKKLMKGGRRLVGSLNVNMLLERLKMGKKDGIIIWKGNGDQRFGLQPNESYPTWAIVFDPSQIKSADPVTRDDAGNVIPLSQRFKATSEDIRYMPASDQDTKALQMLPKPRRSLDAAYRDGVKTRNQDPQYYDVPDYVGYDMARTAAFEMGREGAEPPRWVMAERIGKLPTEGRSKNFAEDRMERGVSVLRIVGEPQSDAGTYEMFNPGEKRYVAGWLVGLGSDGEPLLADAVDLGSASNDVRMMPSPDSAMLGAYSFPGGYRALPGKAKGSFRLYGPAGSLLGIASSLDEAQRIIRKKAKQ